MSEGYFMKPIARIRTDFPEKFGIPRQSGMLRSLKARIEPETGYASFDAFRGIEGYSHLWLIWVFSENLRPEEPRRNGERSRGAGTDGVSLTVRPPRLGGNTRVGVFASRSPFRPNPIGLSCVRLEGVETDADGRPVLIVSGADMVDGTPILDIKPYIPYSDSYPDALSGFAQDEEAHVLRVVWETPLPVDMNAEKAEALNRLLSLDPRPSYHDDGRDYGVSFAGYNIRFRVEGEQLHVLSAEALPMPDTGDRKPSCAGGKGYAPSSFTKKY